MSVDLKERRLYVALPIFDKPETDFMVSLLVLCLRLAQSGVDFTIDVVRDSHITRGRNRLANNMLRANREPDRKDKPYTHLLFLDADLVFSAEDVLAMLTSGHDLIGCVYPVKSIDWESVKKAMDKGVENIEEFTARYVVNFIPNKVLENTGDKVTMQIEVVDGCVEVQDIGTGMLLIAKETFEKLALQPSVLTYWDDMPGAQRGQINHDFFNTFIDDSGRWLSEDYAFCRRFQQMGGKAMAYLPAKVNHIGKYIYQGSVSAIMKNAETDPSVGSAGAQPAADEPGPGKTG